jgi:hypothetical protein
VNSERKIEKSIEHQKKAKIRMPHNNTAENNFNKKQKKKELIINKDEPTSTKQIYHDKLEKLEMLENLIAQK